MVSQNACILQLDVYIVSFTAEPLNEGSLHGREDGVIRVQDRVGVLLIESQFIHSINFCVVFECIRDIMNSIYQIRLCESLS